MACFASNGAHIWATMSQLGLKVTGRFIRSGQHIPARADVSARRYTTVCHRSFTLRDSLLQGISPGWLHRIRQISCTIII